MIRIVLTYNEQQDWMPTMYRYQYQYLYQYKHTTVQCHHLYVMYTGASISIYQYKRTTVQCHYLYKRKRNQKKKKNLKEPIPKEIINKLVEVDINVDIFKSPNQSKSFYACKLISVVCLFRLRLVKSIFTLLITISVNQPDQLSTLMNIVGKQEESLQD